MKKIIREFDFIKILKLLIGFVYLISSLVVGEEMADGLELKILKLDESVYVTVKNNGIDVKTLDSNLCVNSIGDLSFNMRNDNGVVYKVAVKFNERCVLNRTASLGSKEFIGKEFNLYFLKAIYKLPSERIYMKAILCKKKSNCIESNEVKLYF